MTLRPESTPLAVARPATPRPSRAASDLMRVLTLNTHRGQGPNLSYLLDNGSPDDHLRNRACHEASGYPYQISEWLRQHSDLHDVVGLQEVFVGLLGGASRVLRRRVAQHECYRAVGGFTHAFIHRIGHPAFRYQNVLLSRLPRAESDAFHLPLPGRVFRLATCGVSFAPLRWAGRTVWVGNTHLHAYNARKRGRQAVEIAHVVRALGDVPVVLLGDLNMVPAGCRDADFPHGGRELKAYKNDRTFAVLEGAGLRSVPHADRPEFWTHPTGVPNRTLDYVLFSRHWEVESYRVRTDFTLSDHLPVEAALRLRRPESGEAAPPA